jgi:hypothetical protein
MKNYPNTFIILYLLFCAFAFNYHSLCSRIHHEKSFVKKNLEILRELNEKGLDKEIAEHKSELIQNIKEGKIIFSKYNLLKFISNFFSRGGNE